MVTPPATAGTEIQRLRQARGLSLRQLARQAGISAAALSRWETLKRLPSIPELEAVLIALDATAAQKRDILHCIDAPRAVHRLRALDAAADEAYNSGGALLWAMRQRKGWTQERVAQAVGVTQVQIARWENGDSWPDTSELHTLSWCLDAHPDEIAALTRHPTRAGGGSLLPEETVRDWGNSEWADHVKQLLLWPPPEALLALTFIGVQQQLSRVSAHNDFATTLLPGVYAIHARHCLSRRETKLAIHWAERGLALMRRQKLSDPTASGGNPLWFGNVLVIASAASKNKRISELRRAGKLLSDWLPVVRQAAESRDRAIAPSAAAHHAWGLMTYAETLQQLGHTHAALERAKISCQEAEQMDPSEGAMRLYDFACLLRDTHQPAQALQTLARREKLLPLDREVAATQARHHLLEAECLNASGDKQRANEQARAAEQLIQQNNIWSMQPEWQRIAASL